MKRGIYLAAAVLVLWGGAGVNDASAQFRSPFGRMGQGGIQPYGVIRTPTEANQIAVDQRIVTGLNPDGSLKVPLATQTDTGGLGGLQTGHPVSFFDYGGYFPLTPPGRTGAGSTTGFGSGVSNTPYGTTQSGPRFLFGAGLNRNR